VCVNCIDPTDKEFCKSWKFMAVACKVCARGDIERERVSERARERERERGERERRGREREQERE
jgi:hypothetical protein